MSVVFPSLKWEWLVRVVIPWFESRPEGDVTCLLFESILLEIKPIIIDNFN